VDISDGVIADAGHLAAASGVGIRIDLDRLPREPQMDCLDAAASGEEYELLLALPPTAAVHDFEALFRLPLSEIGVVIDRAEPGVETFRHGVSVAPPRGYDHFS
jgi:thiamine-monophosphate kinase